MKLTHLTASDFLGLKYVDLDLSRPVNLVLGRNGAGKSSVRDAIQYALIGRCRSTDAAGRGADSLIRRGEERLTVFLQTEAGSIERSKTIGRPATHNGLTPDASSDLIEALLDMPHLLRLPSKERSTILSAVISPQASIDDIRRHALALSLSDAAIGSLLGGFGGIGKGPYGPAEIAQAHERCYTKRKAVKAELADLKAKLSAVPAGPVPTADDLATAESALETLTCRAGDLREQFGSAQERSRRRAELLVEGERLTEQIAAATSAAEPAQSALPLGPSLEALSEQLAGAQVHAKAAQDAKDAAISEKQARASEEEQIRRQMASLESSGGLCDGAFAPEKLPCPVMAQRQEKAAASVDALRKRLSKAQTAFGAAQATEGKARKAWQDAETEVDRIERLLHAARESAAASGAVDAERLAQLERRYSEVETALERLGDPDSDVRRIQTEQESLAVQSREARDRRDRIRAALDSAGEHMRLRGQVEAKTALVAIFEELVPALEKGIPARILAEKVGPVQRRINEQLATITGGVYRVAIRAEKDLDLDVYKSSPDSDLPLPPLPPECLSASEQLRLGVALAQAVSIASGLRILVIDEADMLDPGNRGLLMQGVLALTQEIHTTIILATALRPMTSTTEQLGVCWMEDGAAALVEQLEEVAP